MDDVSLNDLSSSIIGGAVGFLSFDGRGCGLPQELRGVAAPGGMMDGIGASVLGRERWPAKLREAREAVDARALVAPPVAASGDLG